MRRYEEVAFRTAFLVCGDADEALDAAQEGFVRAWRALPRFRAADPRPWLLRIVANAARNRRRGSSRQAALGLRGGGPPLGRCSPIARGVGPAAGERREALLAAIERRRPRTGS